jgi:hypothetical protein
MTNCHPDVDLVRLLEALGREVVATTDEDVCRVCAAHQRSVRATAGEVRRLLAVMIDIDDPSGPGDVPPAQPTRDVERRRRLEWNVRLLALGPYRKAP